MFARIVKYGALAKAGAIKHSTGLLTFCSGVGIVVSGYLWFKAGAKSTKKLTAIELEKGELTNSEKAKIIAKQSIVPASVSALTIGMIIASGIINIRRQKALSTALALSSEAFSTYRDKVVETLGEEKEHEMRGEMAKDAMKKDNVTESVIYSTGHGDQLFKCGVGDTYFRADVNWIRTQQIDILQWYKTDEFISVNDWRGYLGLPPLDDVYDYLGWGIDPGLNFDIDYAPCPNGEICGTLDYSKSPVSAHPDILKYCRVSF